MFVLWDRTDRALSSKQNDRALAAQKGSNNNNNNSVRLVSSNEHVTFHTDMAATCTRWEWDRSLDNLKTPSKTLHGSSPKGL